MFALAEFPPFLRAAIRIERTVWTWPAAGLLAWWERYTERQVSAMLAGFIPAANHPPQSAELHLNFQSPLGLVFYSIVMLPLLLRLPLASHIGHRSCSVRSLEMGFPSVRWWVVCFSFHHEATLQDGYR